MSLVDDIRKASMKRVTPCKTGVWFSGQSDEVREAAENYLADGLPASELHRNCVRYGCPASETTFRAHCHRRCSCYIGGDK